MANNKKKVSTLDVAKEAGVSQSTVSMILNGCKYVSFKEETKQKVYQACIATGYRTLAAKSSEAGSRIILTVCPSCENPDYLKAVNSIQTNCASIGYSNITYFSLRDTQLENMIVSTVQAVRAAGVIFLYQPQNPWLMKEVDSICPTISVCDHSPNIDFDAIEMNSSEIGAIIAQHLIDNGHEKVAYVMPSLSNKFLLRQRRLEGVKETYRRNGYNPDECIIVCTAESEHLESSDQFTDYEAGFYLANRIMDNYAVSAIVGNNDTVCFGIIDALQRRKKRIPQDYSVCGCDNTIMSNMKSISLTTVENFTKLRASEAVEQLVKKIQRATNVNGDDYPISTVKVEYKPKLIIRNSTAPVKP